MGMRGGLVLGHVEGMRDGCTGWVQGGYRVEYVTRVGTGRAIPGTHPAARGALPVQRSGPRKALQGPGVGGTGRAGVPAAVRTPDPPSGPGRSPWALPGLGS